MNNDRNKWKQKIESGNLFPVKNPHDKPIKMRIGISEDRLQENCVHWFDLQYARFIYLMFHIANGGKRDAKEAMKFKRMGVRRGVADLFLSIPNSEYHGLYLELKVGDNTQTENQIMFMRWAQSMKYNYIVIRTIEQFIDAIQEHMKKTAWFKPTWTDQKKIEKSVVPSEIQKIEKSDKKSVSRQKSTKKHVINR
jgi:hypothetical protein